MVNFAGLIEDVPLGDSLTIRRTVTNVPVGDSLSKAWWTVKEKETDTAPILIQKAITTVDVTDVGQIEDTGAGDTIGVVRFDLVNADSAGQNLKAKSYFYDIQVLTVAGHIYTPEKGIISFVKEITEAIA